MAHEYDRRTLLRMGALAGTVGIAGCLGDDNGNGDGGDDGGADDTNDTDDTAANNDTAGDDESADANNDTNGTEDGATDEANETAGDENTTNDTETADNDTEENETEGNETTDDSDGGGEYETMLSVPSLEFPFFARMEQAFEQATAEDNLSGSFFDAQDDQAQQVSHVENAITEEVDFMMISPITADGIVPAIEQANEAEIPVVTIDRDAADGETATYVASDNVELGRRASELCFEFMQEIEDKDTYHMVELQGTQGASVTNDRQAGGEQTLEDNDNLELLASDDGDFSNVEALSVMENFLTQHGDEIDGVFCHNDLMAEGVHEALAANDVTEMPVVGIDGSEAWAELIQDNEYYGTIAQLPEEMVMQAVEAGIDAVEGADLEDEYAIEGLEVTQDNAEDYLGEYF